MKNKYTFAFFYSTLIIILNAPKIVIGKAEVNITIIKAFLGNVYPKY
jgi:hypothetical protein